MKTFISLLNKRYLPGWIIFTADQATAAMSFLLAYILRLNFVINPDDLTTIFSQLLAVTALNMAGSLIFKSYLGIIRYTTARDILQLVYSVSISNALLLLFSFGFRNLDLYPGMIIPYSVIIIYALINGSLSMAGRLVVRYIYINILNGRKPTVPVMIYGAGDLGQTTLMVIEKSTDVSYKPVGFIDSDPRLHNKKKSGINIYSPGDSMKKIIPSKNVKMIIISISPDRLIKEENELLINYCLDHKIEVRKVPKIKDFINESFSIRHIKPIDIADLLDRREIKLNVSEIQKSLTNKTVLVTGAAGSIGSEIIRQLTAFRTKKVILLDQAESALYDIETELKSRYGKKGLYEVVIADVSDKRRMEKVFDKYRPEIVFNASAYKHVPLLEDNVCEAIRVNIGGTKNLADLSVRFGVEKFVMISTDKAINPTSVMGASKRICEMYVQSFSGIAAITTQFVTTRFGNVLGSNGSVIPLFARQLEAGGPLTVTHRDITRYFMTIPEACQLVLEAGFMGKGGEIFIFDMGEPVNIYDLAVKMIRLSGLEPGKDVHITETGLRPGEKLYEELLNEKESILPTHHPKILIASTRTTDHMAIEKDILHLIRASKTETETELVRQMIKTVPEFSPANPKYILHAISEQVEKQQE